jgi:hypothetical protein
MVMKERATYSGKSPQIGQRVDLSDEPPRPAGDSGIEVHEEQCGTVTAQRVYKMRCECGRSWFELELPKGVRCPACQKFGLVSCSTESIL